MLNVLGLSYLWVGKSLSRRRVDIHNWKDRSLKSIFNDLANHILSFT